MNRKLIVYFAGVDGSGKTTIAESLCDPLRRYGLSCKYLWGGWRGFESAPFKPIVSRAKKALTKKSQAEKVREAHEKLPLFGYLVWLDYFVRIYPPLFLSLITRDVVVLDRYIYDVIAGLTSEDKRINRFLFALFKVFPRPSIVFFISIPLKLAYSRKNDIPSIDFLRQVEQKNLNILAQSSVNLIKLDGTRSKNELLSDVLAIIQSRMT
jgi:thymidylate kinase